MTSIDTNILYAATQRNAPRHEEANTFVNANRDDRSFLVCELALTELYMLLRNPAVTNTPLTPAAAANHCQQFRQHPRWQLIENAPVMDKVWKISSSPGFARRRIFDVRLALTLQHHRVTHFATANVKDFKNLGFEKVWDPTK